MYKVALAGEASLAGVLNYADDLAISRVIWGEAALPRFSYISIIFCALSRTPVWMACLIEGCGEPATLVQAGRGPAAFQDLATAYSETQAGRN